MYGGLNGGWRDWVAKRPEYSAEGSHDAIYAAQRRYEDYFLMMAEGIPQFPEWQRLSDGTSAAAIHAYIGCLLDGLTRSDEVCDRFIRQNSELIAQELPRFGFVRISRSVDGDKAA